MTEPALRRKGWLDVESSFFEAAAPFREDEATKRRMKIGLASESERNVVRVDGLMSAAATATAGLLAT